MAIVGAGIAGLTAAVLLKKAGRTVAVLEKNRIATGETGFTTAHITDVFDARFQTLISNFGEDQARLAVESVRHARQQIERLIVEFAIECHFQQLPGYLFCNAEHEDFDFLRKEEAAARAAGLTVELVSGAPLPFSTGAALRFENQAQFHPRKYLLPLANWINSEGSHVFEDWRR